MSYKLIPTAKFRKDMKRIKKRGYDLRLLTEVLDLLATGSVLPEKYKDHALSGNYQGHRECHISPDWLLIYRVEAGMLVLVLSRTGTHSDLY